MSACRVVALVALLLPVPAIAQDESARVLNPLASLDKRTLKGFVGKPLFESSRHSPTVTAPVAKVLPPPPPPRVEPPPSLRLIGIVEGAHWLAAIVHRNDTGKTETLRPGDHIGTWTVEVRPAALRMVSGDRAFDYAMFPSNLQQEPTIAARDPAASGSR